MKQTEWTFGSWDRRQVGEHLFVGTSMFDNIDTYIGIDADAEHLLIYYNIGDDPEHLYARNMVRIVAEPDFQNSQRCQNSVAFLPYQGSQHRE